MFDSLTQLLDFSGLETHLPQSFNQPGFVYYGHLMYFIFQYIPQVLNWACIWWVLNPWWFLNAILPAPCPHILCSMAWGRVLFGNLCFLSALFQPSYLACHHSVCLIKKKEEWNLHLGSSRGRKLFQKEKTSRADRKILGLALVHQWQSCRKIATLAGEEGIGLLPWSVSNKLLDVGFRAYRPPNEPYLTKAMQSLC